jgi:predicted PhzF superfamily epimerase YddE/YHI9
LDFPTAPLDEVPADPELAALLGADIVAQYHTGPTTDDYLVELASEAVVRGLRPDLPGIGRLVQRGVVVTARAESADAGYDFVSRFFAPAVGIPEDPVTGSAHTALGPYWSGRLGRDNLTGLQASARTGLVRTTVRGDRVDLTGRAITVVDGTLHHIV